MGRNEYSTVLSERPSRQRSHGYGFYTPAQASRIAMVPEWTLSSWRRQGVIIPSADWHDEQDRSYTGYTFETLVYLRLVRLLRDNRITLLKAVEAVKSIRDRFGPPGRRWAEVRIIPDNGEAFVYHADEWSTTVATRHNQRVAEALLGKEFELLKDRIDALLIPQQYMAFVEIDPAIRNGLPLVYGTSMLTSVIHKLVAHGQTYGAIRYMYPFLPLDKISGADQYEIFLDKAVIETVTA